MWEYCIAFNNKNEAQLFKDCVCNTIKLNDGVVTILFSENFAKVLIAVPNKNINKITKYLTEKIAESILLNYKKEFILSRLSFSFNQKINMQVFLKALIVFDSDTDKEIIIQRLNLNHDIVIKSFIDFKLKFLKKKWLELVDLANDNAMYLVSEDTFNELIKFLISNLEYRCYAVNVFSKNNCFLLCDTQGKVISDFLVDKNIVYDDVNLLTSLIALNPEKIIVHCNSDTQEKTINKLFQYFSNRLEICK